MNINAYKVELETRARVIALHCSGGGAAQWANLTCALGDSYEVLTPEQYGSEATGPWTGEHVFTIADEAASTIDLIDRGEEKVHLVGHSYGGGVALHAALARPHKIASMALYEPSAFHLLRQIGDVGLQAIIEIARVAQRFSDGVVTGDYRSAVAQFVDYWNGPGTWQAMRPSVQKNLIRWAPKGPLDFRALTEDTTPANAYARLSFPILIMRGQYAPLPTRVIAQILPNLLPSSRSVVVEGAGHMGPLTHASAVSAWLVEHIRAVDSAEASPVRGAPSQLAKRASICGAYQLSSC
jgi:pimeloyl-ACP methyl ester carboxylesterase